MGGADHYRALHPGYQPGCQQWHHGSPIFPHLSPCPTGALARDRLTVMSWSCWCASVCTKAVVSQMCNEPVTTAGSSGMLRVLRCPCLRNDKGATGPALLQKALLSGCSLKIITIFYSNHLSSQKPCWLLISQIYPVPLWAFW